MKSTEISHETSIFSSTTDDPTSELEKATLDSIDAEPNIFTETESIDRFFQHVIDCLGETCICSRSFIYLF